MNKYIEDRKIFKKIMARLVPPNNTYPDCMCYVLLTEDFMYVLEDEFNGDFTYHFKIPVIAIVSVEKYTSESKGNFAGKIEYSPSNLVAAILESFGILMISGSKKKEKREIFLRINYKDEKEKLCSIFFNACNYIEINDIINAFYKIKSKKVAI